MNCGPRSRFVVMGANGPMIVHNCENVTQATARDVLAEAMMHTYQTSFVPLLTVHDELIGEADKADADDALAELVAAMSLTPAWAPGLPVGAEGWHGPRYKK